MIDKIFQELLNLKTMFINENYIPKGAIKNVPHHIIDKMILEQVKQDNPANVEVFENKIDATKKEGGFDWNKTGDGYNYWFRIFQHYKVPNVETKSEEKQQYKLYKVDGKTVVGIYKIMDTLVYANLNSIEELEDAMKNRGTVEMSITRNFEEIEDKKEEFIPYTFEELMDKMQTTLIHKEMKKLLCINSIKELSDGRIVINNNHSPQELLEQYLTYPDKNPFGKKI